MKRKYKGNFRGRTYADGLARRRRIKEAVREMAKDTTVEIQTNWIG